MNSVKSLYLALRSSMPFIFELIRVSRNWTYGLHETRHECSDWKRY